jgi:hypothetical protein
MIIKIQKKILKIENTHYCQGYGVRETLSGVVGV